MLSNFSKSLSIKIKSIFCLCPTGGIPPIATLWKIADGFEVPFSLFVENKDLNQYSFIYRNPELQQIHKDDKINIMPIFPFDKNLGFEVFIIELLPGCIYFSLPHQKGVIEHAISINGIIEVLIEDTWRIVNKHEGLRFLADLPHGYRNLSNKTSLFHNMLHYTK